jgi:hypothetical protein
VSVAVLIDKFVSATALIKFEEVERTLNLRKSREVLFLMRLLSPALNPELCAARLANLNVIRNQCPSRSCRHY